MEDMLKTLARRSFAASRVRNWIAVLAIALTAALFTAITAIVLGTVESFTLTLQMQKMSRSDGDVRYMTAEQFQALGQAEFIQAAGLRMPVAYLSNAVRHNIEFNVQDEIQSELTFCTPTHGREPSAPNEVVASDLALRDLGVEPEAGAEITIVFTAHGQEYALPMVVSGWYEALGSQLSVMWAGAAFRDAHPEIFRYTYHLDGDMAGTYFSDFTAHSALGLEKKLRELVYDLGGEPDDQTAPNYILTTVNRATNVQPSAFQIAAAAAFAALFMFCGYLLIYNVFDIAVMQDIRRFGLYRTIGMSRRQVRTLVNRQALWLSGIGIPHRGLPLCGERRAAGLPPERPRGQHSPAGLVQPGAEPAENRVYHAVPDAVRGAFELRGHGGGQHGRRKGDRLHDPDGFRRGECGQRQQHQGVYAAL